MPVFDGKFRDRLQSRSFLKRSKTRVGRGNVISGAKQRVERVSSRIKDRKPNIIPNVEEALGRWNAGSRITEMLPASLREKPKTAIERRKEKKVSGQSGADISL